MKTCEMCGRKSKLVIRWYLRDDGQQEANRVCYACADLHKNLLRKAVK